ncbi:MAG: sensor histidine kinase [Clostridia bacterium]|nr:sensor histidine kinase [Clostridia bacterium]
MRELSLNVLDIAQNSIVAGATLITLSVIEDTESDRLTLVIADNGRGMTSEQLAQVRDPFYTTRSTRKVGMGVPLFRMAAEMAGGELTIQSTIGQGTVVTATFGLTHIDRMPLGDMAGTVSTLIRLNPHLDFVYCHKVDDRSFELDTRALREVLDDVPLSEPDVMEWIDANMAEGLLPLNSQA